MPKNPKRGHLGSLNVFYNPETWIPKTWILKFSRKKSQSAKKTQRGTLWSHWYFWKHKKLWFSAKIEPTLSGFRKLVEVEQMKKL